MLKLSARNGKREDSQGTAAPSLKREILAMRSGSLSTFQTPSLSVFFPLMNKHNPSFYSGCDFEKQLQKSNETKLINVEVLNKNLPLSARKISFEIDKNRRDSSASDKSTIVEGVASESKLSIFDKVDDFSTDKKECKMVPRNLNFEGNFEDIQISSNGIVQPTKMSEEEIITVKDVDIQSSSIACGVFQETDTKSLTEEKICDLQKKIENLSKELILKSTSTSTSEQLEYLPWSCYLSWIFWLIGVLLFFSLFLGILVLWFFSDLLMSKSVDIYRGAY